MACMYLVTLVLQFCMGFLWMTLICGKCNPWCKPCLLNCAAYIDEDLPHPVTKWIILYGLFRPSSYTWFHKRMRKSYKQHKSLQRQKIVLEKKLRKINSKLESVDYESSLMRRNCTPDLSRLPSEIGVINEELKDTRFTETVDIGAVPPTTAPVGSSPPNSRNRSIVPSLRSKSAKTFNEYSPSRTPS